MAMNLHGKLLIKVGPDWAPVSATENISLEFGGVVSKLKPVQLIGPFDIVSDVLPAPLEYHAFSQQLMQQVATGLLLSAHLFEGESNFASAATTASAWARQLAVKLKAELQRLRHEELRVWSRNIDRLQCPHCGRKPTITGVDGPDAMHLCDRTMAALRRVFGDQPPEVLAHFGPNRLGSLELVPFPCVARAPLQ